MMQQQVIRAALAAWRRGESGALGTIVAVEGSAYQREGASVFVAPDGGVQGLISGGCLESEVAGEAQGLPAATPRVLTYDTSDESIFGYGMGCPGVVDVLLERLPPGDTPLGRFLERVAEGVPAARGVRLDHARQGVLTDICYIPGRPLSGSLGDQQLDRAFIRLAQERLETSRVPEAGRIEELKSADVFAWVVPAEAECVIFGATDDAQPLAQMAAEIGLKVDVVDPRPHLATSERFPTAHVRQLALRDYPGAVELGRQSYVVVMGHQVERDLAALKLAIQAEVPYIGLLSSQGRRDSMLGHLRQDGVVEAGGDPPTLHSPAGLWIGARTPEEIALSIVAEICSVRRGASR